VASGAAAIRAAPAAAESPYVRDLAGLTDNQRAVLLALADAPEHQATTPALAAATGVELERTREAAVALIERSLARPAGAGAAPKRGGRRPVVYAATPHGLAVASMAKVPPLGAAPAAAPLPEAAPEAERLLREALSDG